MFYSELNRSEIIHAFIVNKSHFFFGKAPAEGDFFHLNHKKKLPAQHERFLSLCLRFRSFVLFKFPLLLKKRLIRGDDIQSGDDFKSMLTRRSKMIVSSKSSFVPLSRGKFYVLGQLDSGSYEKGKCVAITTGKIKM